MLIITRRDALKLGAAAALTGTALTGRAFGAGIPTADVQPPDLPIEKGASLRVLRPTKFVDADEPVWRENTKKFSDAMGVPVRVDFVGWEDLRPQTAVTANTGAGPDIVVGWPDDPHIYATHLREVSDIAEYLGKKYGGWYFLADKYGKKWGTQNWIGLPMGASGGPLVYRDSWFKEVGYDTVPNDMDKVLDLFTKLKAKNHPVGFALGNAVGDANSYVEWVLWAFGGYVANEDGKVSIDRKETIDALKWAKAMYPTQIDGVLSWGDPSNNKAFLAGQIAATTNGVSIYYAAKQDPNSIAPAADISHARLPSGVVGRPPESGLMLNAMVFQHTKYPNAAKQYLRYMMEAEQYDKWLTACAGYWSQPLMAYSNSEVWTIDPKISAYKTTAANTFWNGYKGPINAASGAVVADYVLVHMFAAVATGQSTPEDAAKEAQKRAERYYNKA
jgi:multiple sugar transport system substrate-binding protein